VLDEIERQVLILMIVFRPHERLIEPGAVLDAAEDAIDALARQRTPTYDQIVEALIDVGELASAVADARSGNADAADDVPSPLADLTERLADAADASWRGDDAAVGRAIGAAQLAAQQCVDLPLPSRAIGRVSEGFAYFALGPELYAEAARAWAQQAAPQQVWCIGLRTIGFTLAAVVSAALRAQHIDSRVKSMRPRGHPFKRRVLLDPEFAAELRPTGDAWYLVIDAGPGPSGSSMAATAERLAHLGVHDDRIVLMPAHKPKIDLFGYASVRQRWRRHRVWAANDDQTWISSARLQRTLQADRLSDISGGRWRQHRALDIPVAVHPQHERPKYLVHRGPERTLLKFAGYGHYGAAVAARAEAAADGGWAPRPHSFRGGWLEFPWLSLRSPGKAITTTSIAHLADYIAFVAETWSTGSRASPDALVEMAVTNAGALGVGAAIVEQLKPAEDVPAVCLDARMRPHEWLERPHGYLKTDGIEHFADRFYPGPTDIAWDVAGILEEWPLGRDGSRFLVDRYAKQSRDWTIARRLPFYRAAYLAFRAGYTSFSADQLTGTPEAATFRVESDRYRTRLREVLEQGVSIASRVY